MILTITMNPSVDKRFNVEDFDLGGVYRTSDYGYTPGGKGINVAKVVKDLNYKVLATGLLGGRSGEFIIDELEEMDIDNEFIKIDGNTRGCLNIISSTGVQTEVLEAGPTISEDEYSKFLEFYDGILDKVDLVVASGSLPLGLREDSYNDLIEMARKKGKKFILDTSKDRLKKGLEAKPYLIKPNETEMMDLTGLDVSNEDELVPAMKKINELGVEIVVVSLGGDGAILSTENTTLRAWAPKVEVQNTVGSGDSMIAGMSIAIDEELELEEILRYGIAAGSANAMEIETGKVNIENFNRLMKEIKIENLE